MAISPSTKIAIVHDCLTVLGGAEKVLKDILTIFPQADLYAIVDFFPENIRSEIRHKKAKTTFIQKLPFARKLYSHYLPLMPFAVEQFDLSDYAIIISSSYAVAKGVIPSADQLHICYCHSPLRYAWDMRARDFNDFKIKGLKKIVMELLLHRLRYWDAISANRVDYFVANSAYVAGRIQKAYRRSAKIIFPGVEVNQFTLQTEKDDFYLTASRAVNHKRMDLIMEAFIHMPKKKLVVIGSGPDFKKLAKQRAANITLLGYQPLAILKSYMQRARAFIFAAREDFGIMPLEAQACGTPVIAYGRGGLLETILGLDKPNPTGVFFAEQTVEAIRDSVELFEKNSHRIQAENCRKNAERFSTERFCVEFNNYVTTLVKDKT